MINSVSLVGRLTRDVDLHQTFNGTHTVQFTVACNRSKSQSQEADFINCVAWGGTADFMAQYLKKGALVGIQGRIQSRSYEKNDGQKVYVQEVHVSQLDSLETKAMAENRNNGYQQNYQSEYGSDYQQSYEGMPWD